jgi:hypothetical protein
MFAIPVMAKGSPTAASKPRRGRYAFTLEKVKGGFKVSRVREFPSRGEADIESLKLLAIWGDASSITLERELVNGEVLSAAMLKRTVPPRVGKAEKMTPGQIVGNLIGILFGAALLMSAMRDLRRGYVTGRSGVFQRSDRPVTFWFGITLNVIVGTAFLGISLGFDIGMWLGWWKPVPAPY